MLKFAQMLPSMVIISSGPSKEQNPVWKYIVMKCLQNIHKIFNTNRRELLSF